MNQLRNLQATPMTYMRSGWPGLALLLVVVSTLYFLGGYLASFAALLILIIIHEIGHWIPARILGINVTTFSVGFGKALYEHPQKIWGTNFQVCNIPLGGYILPDEKELQAAPIWKRAIFISGGPCMNILCAVLITFCSYMLVGEPQQFVPRASAVAELDSKITKAYDGGLRVGDEIVTIAGQHVITAGEIFAALESNKSSPVPMVVKRNDKEVVLTIDHDANQKMGLRGLRELGSTPYLPVGFSTALFDATKDTANKSAATLVWIGKLLHIVPKSKAEQVDAAQLQSLIGIVHTGGEFFQGGLASFLTFAAVLSLSLGVLNFLPFPALDGGHLMFLAIEKVRGKAVPIMIQRWSSLGTITLLLAVTIYAAHNDLIRLVGPLMATPITVALVCILVRYLVPQSAWLSLANSLRRQ